MSVINIRFPKNAIINILPEEDSDNESNDEQIEKQIEKLTDEMNAYDEQHKLDGVLITNLYACIEELEKEVAQLKKAKAEEDTSSVEHEEKKQDLNPKKRLFKVIKIKKVRDNNKKQEGLTLAEYEDIALKFF